MTPTAHFEIIIMDPMHPIPNENQQLQDNCSLFCVEKWQHGIVGNLVEPKPRESAKNPNSKILTTHL